MFLTLKRMFLTLKKNIYDLLLSFAAITKFPITMR